MCATSEAAPVGNDVMTQQSVCVAVIDTPPGRLAIQATDDWLVGIDYVSGRVPLKKPLGKLAEEVVGQLRDYFQDAAHVFDVPVYLHGTPHQNKVWQALRKIKTGSTVTYGELARQVDSSARAVGNSCRHNPVSIVVPCHRVVGAAGIGGYGGRIDGRVLDRKHWLLQHEGIVKYVDPS